MTEDLNDDASIIATQLASHDRHNIWIRDLDLVREIMGERSFTEVVFLLIAQRLPDENERIVLDAVLVSLIEHGLTPSAIVSRITYSVAPESLQGAVAAGLLGAGSRVLGSMEECGRILTELGDVADAGDHRSAVVELVQRYRKEKRRFPGLGHVVHVDGDPRASRLDQIAREHGLETSFLDKLKDLSHEASLVHGRDLLPNVTGAVAAILLGLGVPWQLHRGFALISRSAGLVAHIGEERQHPVAPSFRQLGRDASTNDRKGIKE